MARAIFLNASLTGKLGGQVYSRNKGGAYVRAYVKPTNPRTNQQLLVRSGFSDASKAWYGLLATEQGGWNGYAITGFKPKRGKVGVTYSGANAFVSLRNTVIQINKNFRAATFTVPTGVTATFTNSVAVTTAPVGIFSGQPCTHSNLPIPLTLAAATLTQAGIVTFQINMGIGNGTDPIVFKDASTARKVGFVVFGNIAGSKRPTDTNCIGFTGFPTITAGMTSNITSFTMSMAAADINTANRKLWYQTGQKMVITVYTVSDVGEWAPVGSANVIVT
jgi:hypothetical protein